MLVDRMGRMQAAAKAIRTVCLVLVPIGAYFLSLWLRWNRHVPTHLWGQLAAILPFAVVGAFAGAGLVDFWSNRRMPVASLYVSLVTSLSSVVAAMAAVYAFRATDLPRLTFPLAFGVTWASLTACDVLLATARRQLLKASTRGQEAGAIAGGEGVEGKGESLLTYITYPISSTYAAEAAGEDTYGVSPAPCDGGGGLERLNHCHSARSIQWATQMFEDHQSLVILPRASELLLASAKFIEDGDRLLLAIRPRACQWPFPAIKRLADIIVSLVGLVLSLPLWVLAGIAIRLDSPGPVFFRQARVGERGRIFHVLKFRTMVQDAEAKTGAVLAAEEDPRVTRTGRRLRALRLDELPQLINVLRGEMSLVGPRPERPEFVANFRATIEGYDLRHLVKPGITGLAQIRGRYDTPAEDKLRFDLAYIFLWSPILDFKIMLQTVGVMLTPELARSSLKSAAPLPARAEDAVRPSPAGVHAAVASDNSSPGAGETSRR